MATGDAAAAAGLYVVPATKDKRLGYDDINRRGDELAAHMTGAHAHSFEHIDGTVTAAQIGDLQVGTAELADQAVTTAKIADLGVTTAKIAASAVVNGKLGAKAVTGAKIDDATIVAGNLANSAVTTAKINDGAVTNAKLGSGAVSGAKLAATLSKTGTLVVESDTVTVRDNTNTDKLTVGGGFTLTSNQESTVEASTLHLDADFSIQLDAGSSIQLDADTYVQITSHDGGIGIHSDEGVTIDTGSANGVSIDGATQTVISGASADLKLSADSDGAYLRSPAVYGRTYSNSPNMFVTSEGTLGRSTSSARYKTDIEPARPLPTVLDIEPRTWADVADPARHRHYGAIAEELDALGLAELVVYNEAGEPDAIAYDRIVIALIPVVRDLAARLTALEGVTPDAR